MLVLAQVHIDARTEVAAEDVVDHAQLHRFRGIAWRRQLHRVDHALLRARLVHQVHAGFLRLRHLRDIFLRHVASLPAAKRFFQLRQHFRQGGVAHHQQGGVVGLEPALVILDQVVTGNAQHRRFVTAARQRQTVGMLLAVDQARNHAQRHGRRIGFFPADGSELILAQAVQFLLFESRMQHHVGIHVERLRQGGLERVELHERTVEVVVAGDLGAQRFDFLADFCGVALLRAFVEHRQGQAGHAGQFMRVRRITGIDDHRQVDHGRGVALGQHHFQAVRQGGFLHGRQLQRFGLAQRRRLAAVELGGGRVVGRERLHVEHIVAVGQPRVHGLLDGRRRGRLDRLQVILVAVGIAGVGLAAGQQVALAAEATHAFDDAGVLRQDLGLGNLQLGGGGTAFEQRLQFLVGLAFHFSRVGAGTGREHHVELAGDLGRRVAGVHAGGQLLLVHQALVQARSLALAQHVAAQVQQRLDRALGAGHVPHAVDARLRHAVLHRAAVGAGTLGDPLAVLGQRWASRNVSVVLFDFFQRVFGCDVTRQHQRGVVGTVVGLEPLGHVGHAGRVEVGHRADRGPRVRVADRPGVFGEQLARHAVRLVLALALLVLHHAALQVELLLVEHAEQVAHAIALGKQRVVEHRGRHVLEVVGAVGIGGAVEVGRADALQGVQVGLVKIVAAAEHQVFEQVGKAGLARFFILGTHVVPGVDRHHRCLVVFVHQQGQAVLEYKLFVGNIGDGDIGLGDRLDVGRMDGRSGEDGDGRRKDGAAKRNGHALAPERKSAPASVPARFYFIVTWKKLDINYLPQRLPALPKRQ